MRVCCDATFLLFSDTSYMVPDLSVLPPGSLDPAIDIEQETESNHDTALTLAAAGTTDMQCRVVAGEVVSGDSERSFDLYGM